MKTLTTSTMQIVSHVVSQVVSFFLVFASPLLSAQPVASTVDNFNGRPNFNGIWQAVNTAHWNLEAHSAEAIPELREAGAFYAIPAGPSYVQGGTIPYLPEALEQRNANRAAGLAADPASACFMPGIPRATYMPYPFQIVQGEGGFLFVYAFASSNRYIHMEEVEEAPADMWMGWSRGRWEGDTLVIEVTSNDERTWFDRAGNHHSYMMKVTERYRLLGPNHLQYEATIEDPLTFSAPWTISMPLYRNIEPGAELLEYKCVEFAEPLLYGEFEKRD
jgi:hypothetical protein